MNPNETVKLERRGRKAGYKVKPETKAKISETLTGSKYSDERRESMRAAWVIRKAKKASNSQI